MSIAVRAEKSRPPSPRPGPGKSGEKRNTRAEPTPRRETSPDRNGSQYPKEERNQERELQALIQRLRDQDGALMPVLQGAQEIYGYLPIEVMEIIASSMNVSLEEVYGVATFYSQFSLNPKGR